MFIKLIPGLLLMMGFAGHLSFAQKIEAINVSDYPYWLEENDQPIQIVNFWATWCAPCIKELPEFIQAQKDFHSIAGVRLISLDDSQRKTKVRQTLSKHGYLGSIYLLNAQDYELNQLYHGWNGAVPLTLVYNAEQELILAYEKEINYDKIQELINQYIK